MKRTYVLFCITFLVMLYFCNTALYSTYFVEYYITSSNDDAPNRLLHSEEKSKLMSFHRNLVQTGDKLVQNDEGITLDKEARTVEIVVSFCRLKLDWMFSDNILDQMSMNGRATLKINIISMCGMENHVQHFMNDKRVSELNFVPVDNVGSGCDYAYTYFINRYVKNHSLEEASSSIIVFIKDTPRIEESFIDALHERYRSIEELVESAADGNFICGAKFNCNVSPYHSVKRLLNFTLEDYVRQGDKVGESDKFNIHKYINLGDFHNRGLNWSFSNTDYVDVCYGGVFALPASRLITLFHRSTEGRVLEKMEEILSRGDVEGATIEKHFIERTWAGLLAPPLSSVESNTIEQMSKDDFILEVKGSYIGLLLSQSDSTCNKEQIKEKQERNRKQRNLFWAGEKLVRNDERITFDKEARTVEMVVAFCRAKLDWMFSDNILDQMSMNGKATLKINIISKCGMESHVQHFMNDKRVSEFKVSPVDNVGGCDYAYSYFINRYVKNHSLEEASSSIIVFIKDTPRVKDYFNFAFHERYRSIEELVESAADGNFICGAKINCNVSPYHSVSRLLNFTLQDYVRQTVRKKVDSGSFDDFNIHGYTNLRDFHNRGLNWSFSNTDYVNVCYGGVFALPASRLVALSLQSAEGRVLGKMEKVLSRGDVEGTTIEEHFIERTWAGLLSSPLSSEESKTIERMSGDAVEENKSVLGLSTENVTTTCTKDQISVLIEKKNKDEELIKYKEYNKNAQQYKPNEKQKIIIIAGPHNSGFTSMENISAILGSDDGYTEKNDWNWITSPYTTKSFGFLLEGFKSENLTTWLTQKSVI